MKQLTFPAGSQNIQVVYSGKDIGNVGPSFGDNAATNEQKFFTKIDNQPQIIIRMNVRGEDHIIDLTKAPSADWIDCDALVTTKTDQGLSLYAADCIPLVLWSEAIPLLALVHLGRQGASLGLAAKTLHYLEHQYNVPPASFHGWIGPSIKKDSYTFKSEEINERFKGPTWQPFLEERNGLIHADLLGYVLRQLTEAGLSRQNIQVEPIDTGSNSQYFSHHRSKSTGEQEGRNALLVTAFPKVKKANST